MGWWLGSPESGEIHAPHLIKITQPLMLVVPVREATTNAVDKEHWSAPTGDAVPETVPRIGGHEFTSAAASDVIA